MAAPDQTIRKPGRVSLELTRRSTASPEQVFDVLADGANWSRWAGPMVLWSGWEREGDPPPGGVGAIRKLGLPRLGSREQIVTYERPHRMQYTVLAGLPARDYLSTITFEPAPDGGTLIRWSSEFNPLLRGTGWLVRRFLLLTLGSFAKRAAAYAESR